MRSRVEAPRLYSDPNQIILKPNQEKRLATFRVFADGSYNGNGQFRDSADKPYQIIGFDKTGGETIGSGETDKHETIWFGKGYYAEKKGT